MGTVECGAIRYCDALNAPERQEWFRLSSFRAHRICHNWPRIEECGSHDVRGAIEMIAGALGILAPKSRRGATSGHSHERHGEDSSPACAAPELMQNNAPSQKDAHKNGDWTIDRIDPGQ
jgi:hypothetical protein